MRTYWLEMDTVKAKQTACCDEKQGHSGLCLNCFSGLPLRCGKLLILKEEKLNTTTRD